MSIKLTFKSVYIAAHNSFIAIKINRVKQAH